MAERPTSGMLPADYPMSECRICGHWSYQAGVLDDPVCFGCRNEDAYDNYVSERYESLTDFGRSVDQP